MTNPRTRLRILSLSAAGKSYNDISNMTGESKTTVSNVVNGFEDKAEEEGAVQALIQEFIVGVSDVIAHS